MDFLSLFLSLSLFAACARETCATEVGFIAGDWVKIKDAVIAEGK
jgi:hypothetical protein